MFKELNAARENLKEIKNQIKESDTRKKILANNNTTNKIKKHLSQATENYEDGDDEFKEENPVLFTHQMKDAKLCHEITYSIDVLRKQISEIQNFYFELVDRKNEVRYFKLKLLN